ncbi:hypothetical protein P3342_007107 [Pyrenophora teres f. teres]|uniref:RicinB lectin 2 domain containing protein n=1 Tax=Pyrenophora teres f. teres TaxID=97479 RepID=A0A6Y9WJC3_9PLEO|nr:hypothetical protein HRS9139_05609 [Pyrenophora teres f. teres]KAE8840438.1 hypothetical protein PTNB85_03837 [Pyrenophora teres f. teres]KAE8849420.1 hypothetical protein HRS9122_03436 [Pyrenophora teres f. teres]KAE8863937.1 hypothetical protein PTNB29_03901 [Pyrenophora teres f. teres]KAE8866736.1 hypothetical protein PTNB73_04830 [Pyrenophora teres f. teres]
MSDYSGPGLYEIIPQHAQKMSLNVWGGATTAGTAVKLYDRTPSAKNTHFEIVAAGGSSAKPEIGDREYHIIAGNSGLYLAYDDAGKVTVQLRAPLDTSIRWKLAYAGNGAFCINSVNGKKQLNVRGGGKENGTEVITYDLSATSENAQFILKAVV